MPRWLWITLVGATLLLFWAAGRGPGDIAVPVQGGATLGCPPMAFPTGLAEPLQVDVGDAPMVAFEGHTLQPLAGFAIQARVLGREDYRFDRNAGLSPTDLALGWQRMADPAFYKQLDISQGGRWYRYRWGPDGPPLPLEEIIRSSANMHLVPANPSVARAIDRVREDQTVRLKGWLVEIRGDDGWQWRSSLTREDSGDGACELIYVCEFEAW